jgi:hypothetical protein
MREVIHAINAATATTTSSAIPLDDATAVGLQFKRSAHSSGNTVWTVTLSNDGTTYTASAGMMTNAANTNSQTPIRVASVTSSANETVLYVLDPYQAQAFKYMKVVATETTDGTHDAWVCIQRDE